MKVVVNTLCNSPLRLDFLGVAVPFHSFLWCSFVKKKKIMHLGLPQPTRLNSCALPDDWHATRESFPGGFRQGRDGTARYGCVNTGVLQKHCVLPALPSEPPGQARPTQTGQDGDLGPADSTHCALLAAN